MDIVKNFTSLVILIDLDNILKLDDPVVLNYNLSEHLELRVENEGNNNSNLK